MSYAENVVAAVQTYLANLGYYRLRIDGVPGPGTSDATIRFKKANGLAARDFVGVLTLAALVSPEAKPAPAPVAVGIDPAWVTEARSLLGVKEAPGATNNPAIMKWARDLDQWYPGDETAWCGLLVAHCMAAGAPNEPQAFNRLGARAWGAYGVSACEPDEHPPIGAVCTLWRTHPTKSWHGHVFIVTGYDPTTGAVRGIGGNQSDSVSEMWFEGDRVLSYRRPAGVALPLAPVAPRGKLSADES